MTDQPVFENDRILTRRCCGARGNHRKGEHSRVSAKDGHVTGIHLVSVSILLFIHKNYQSLLLHLAHSIRMNIVKTHTDHTIMFGQLILLLNSEILISKENNAALHTVSINDAVSPL